MSRKRRQNRQKQEETQTPGIGWAKPLVAVIALAVLAAVAHFLLRWDQDRLQRSPSRSPVVDATDRDADDTNVDSQESAAADETQETSIGENSQATFEKLKGRWRRTEGTYEIDISNVDGEGQMEATYYNPSPINVSKASAERKDGTLKVFVELQDINYPGCTYQLDYNAEEDSLQGTYTRPEQQFDVVFVRL